MSRLYVSVNARDNARVRKGPLERLIFDDSASMGAIPSLLCGIAAKHECAAERRWLFDFDPPHGHGDEDQVAAFAKEAARCGDFPLESIEVHATPNGYAVIVPHGFDTRELLEEWGSIATLKRDDLLGMNWLRNAG